MLVIKRSLFFLLSHYVANLSSGLVALSPAQGHRVRAAARGTQNCNSLMEVWEQICCPELFNLFSFRLIMLKNSVDIGLNECFNAESMSCPSRSSQHKYPEDNAKEDL